MKTYLKRKLRLAAIAFMALLALVALTLAAAFLTMQTSWFKNKVRERVVAAIEGATGGNVELGGFDYDWRTLTANFKSVVLHGTEPAGAAPLFRADSIRVGLKIVSAFKRDIDIASLIVNRPQVHLLVSPDGKINLPSPNLRRLNAAETVIGLLRLKVGHFEFDHGTLDVDAQSVPLSVRGENVLLLLTYDRRAKRYNVTTASRQLHVNAQQWPATDLEFSAEAQLESDRLVIRRARFISNNSELDASGALEHFAHAVADFQITGRLDAAGLARFSGLTAIKNGQLAFSGKAHYDASTPFRFFGTIAGNNLVYRSRNAVLNRLDFESNLLADSNGAQVTGLRISALGAHFTGKAVASHYRQLKLDGDLSGLGTRQAGELFGAKPLPWSAIASGPVHLELSLINRGENLTIRSNLQIAPAGQGVPVAGNLDLTYERASNLVEFGDSRLTSPSTHLAFSGTVGKSLQIAVDTTNLDDLKPALSFVSERLQTIPLPSLLPKGSAHFDGTVNGPLTDPQLAGDLSLTHFRFQGQIWDQAHSRLTASAGGLEFGSANLEQGPVSAIGSGQVGLDHWTLQPNSPLRLEAQFKRIDIARLTAAVDAQSEMPIRGIASGAIHLTGSLSAPYGSAQLRIDDLDAYGQTLNQTQLAAAIAGDEITVNQARVKAGLAALAFSGAYKHNPGTWSTGEAQIKIDSNGFPLASLGLVRKYGPGLNAQCEIHAEAAARISPGHIQARNAQGTAVFRDVTVRDVPYGSLTFNATTRGQLLETHFSGDLRGSGVSGSARVELVPDNPVTGQLHFDRVALSTLRAALNSRETEPKSVDGFLSADVSFSGPLQRPDKLSGTVFIPEAQFTSRLPVEGTTEAKSTDLIFHNQNPIVLEASNGVATVRSFQIAGPDTKLAVTGSFPYLQGRSINLHVNGSADLRLFQLLDPHVHSTGASFVTASLEGTVADPRVTGTLELKNGSFFFENAPNGLTDVNGTVTFDRDRATIQKLTAQTGGGALSLGGFVSFARPGHLIYRLEANAENVRVRYAGGASVTANSRLQLTGTSENSIVSGTATISRIVFNPNTDVGTLLALAAAPAESPSNEKDFLTGMQFDVRVESAPDFQLNTELSRDVQAEIDLRLRGTPAHPILLGSISANQGEIRVFGTKYSINRGEVSFAGGAKIEPVLDLDLQTQARGITVDVTVSGTLGKLNINYRSDPPLQPRDIIALLTVGRTPDIASNLPNAQIVNDVSALQSGANTVLGQAIAPASNRLSKLFGITNIRIDPMVQGITNTPQARLTVEQNISRQVTVTYVTNLSETSEQIFRLEWAFSPQYSLVALRDDNGEFGIDIQYRKRFK